MIFGEEPTTDLCLKNKDGIRRFVNPILEEMRIMREDYEMFQAVMRFIRYGIKNTTVLYFGAEGMLKPFLKYIPDGVIEHVKLTKMKTIARKETHNLVPLLEEEVKKTGRLTRADAVRWLITIPKKDGTLRSSIHRARESIDKIGDMSSKLKKMQLGNCSYYFEIDEGEDKTFIN